MDPQNLEKDRNTTGLHRKVYSGEAIVFYSPGNRI